MPTKHPPTDLPQVTAVIVLQDIGFGKFSASVTYYPRHELLPPDVIARLDEKSPAIKMANVIMEGLASRAGRIIEREEEQNRTT